MDQTKIKLLLTQFVSSTKNEVRKEAESKIKEMQENNKVSHGIDLFDLLFSSVVRVYANAHHDRQSQL